MSQKMFMKFTVSSRSNPIPPSVKTAPPPPSPAPQSMMVGFNRGPPCMQFMRPSAKVGCGCGGGK